MAVTKLATKATTDDHESRLTTAEGDIVAVQAAQAAGTLGYVDRATMDADLAHDAGTLARVVADATDTNNGDYYKVGASGAGSWTKSTYDTALNTVVDRPRAIDLGVLMADTTI